MLVLLVHGVDVVSHEVYALAQRVRALAQDLDRLLHELDVVFRETTASAASFIGHWHGFSAHLLGVRLSLSSCSSCCILLLAKLSDDLDSATASSLGHVWLGSCVFLLKHLLSLLYEGAIAAVAFETVLLSAHRLLELLAFVLLLVLILVSALVSFLDDGRGLGGCALGALGCLLLLL